MTSRSLLDPLLGAPARVAVLRALAASEIELTGREVGRLAGISAPQANQALENLAVRGVVSRRRAGRAHMYRLNRRLAIVRGGLIPLFRIEGRLLKDALERFRSKAEPLAPVSITLFGSRARGDAREGSDLDLLVVVPERGVEAEGRVREASARTSESLGLRVAPLFVSMRECRAAKGGMRALLRVAAAEGKTIHGRPLADLVRA